MATAMASYFCVQNDCFGTWGAPSDEVCREIKRETGGAGPGWLRRLLHIAARQNGVAEDVRANGPRAYVTVWPVRRVPATTLYRCRVWDGVRASDAFLINAPHCFASREAGLVLTVLAAADEDARDILTLAVSHGVQVEFNEEAIPAAVTEAALAALATDAVTHPAADRIEVCGIPVGLV